MVRYDPVWRVWSDEQHPFGPTGGAIQADSLTRLGPRVWARGTEGGLAYTGGRGWQVWLSQSSWRVAGRPVEMQEVALAAGAPDHSGSLLVHHTGAAGYYDTQTAAWHKLPALPGSGPPRALLWQTEALWLLRGRAVWRLELGRAGQLPGFEQGWRKVTKVDTGTISAIRPRPEGGIFVLSHPACRMAPQPDQPCLRLTAHGPSGRPLDVLLSNENAPPVLQPAQVTHVLTLDSHLLLGGPPGLWAYDGAGRSWRRITASPLTVLSARPVGDAAPPGALGAAFGGPGWVGLISPDAQRVALADMPRQPGEEAEAQPVAVAFDGAGHALVTDSHGRLLRLSLPLSLPPRAVPDGAEVARLETLFAPTAPQEDLSATLVFPGPRHDLYVGSSGLISMDREDRRYGVAPHPGDALATLRRAWALSAHDGHVFGLSGRLSDDEMSLLRVEASDPTRLDRMAVPPTVAMSAIASDAAVMSDPTGRLRRLTIGAKEARLADLMPGQPGAAGDGAAGGALLQSEEVADVTAQGADLFLAAGAGTLRYDGRTRRWHLLDAIAARSLSAAPSGDELTVLRKDGELVSRDLSQPDGVVRSLVLPTPFAFASEAELFDTRRLGDGTLAFLHGRGATGGGVGLMIYDPALRRVTGQVTVQSRGADMARFLDFGSRDPGQWLVLADGRVIGPSGPLPLPPGAEVALNGWFDYETARGLADPAAVVMLLREAGSGRVFLHRLALQQQGAGKAPVRPMHGPSAQGCTLRQAVLPTFSAQAAQRNLSGHLLVRGASAGDGVWLRDPTSHGWVRIKGMPGVGEGGVLLQEGALWAQAETPGETPGETPAETPGAELLHLDLGAISAATGCAPPPAGGVEAATMTRYRRAVVNQDGTHVHQLTDDQRILTGAVGQAQTVLHEVARRPADLADLSAPRRILMTGQAIWMVLDRQIARYDLPTRSWTVPVLVPADVPTRQITLAQGQGRLEGRVVAAWMDGARWKQVDVPQDARPAAAASPSGAPSASWSAGQLMTVPPAPPTLVAEGVVDIRQTPDSLVFRSARHVALLDRRSMRWRGPWGLDLPTGGAAATGQDLRFGLLGRSLFAHAPDSGFLWMLPEYDRAGADDQPHTVRLPQGARLLLPEDGSGPAWRTAAGGLVVCDRQLSCAPRVVDPEVISLVGIEAVHRVPSGHLLRGPGGRGVFLSADGVARISPLATVPAAPAGAMPLEPIGALRGFRDAISGELRLVMSDAQGREWPLGPWPSGLNHVFLRDLAEGGILRLNLADSLALYADGRLSLAGVELGHLPEPHAAPEVRGLGLTRYGTEDLRMDSMLWWQVARRVFLVQVGCLNDSDSDGAAGACQPLQISLPRRVGRVAAIDLSDPAQWQVELEDGRRIGKAQGDWFWDDTEPRFVLPDIGLEAFRAERLSPRPDGLHSLSPGVKLREVGGAGGALVTVSGAPGLEATRWRTPDSLLLSPLDLGWLRLDPDRAALTLMDGGRREVGRLALTRLFDPAGQLRPLAWHSPSPQPDGGVLVASGMGPILFEVAPHLRHDSRVRARSWSDIPQQDLIPDLGGYWLGARFLAFSEAAGAGRAVALDVQHGPGALRLIEDPRHPKAPRLEIDGRRVLSAQGMLWDRIDDIGLDASDRLVLRTPIGALPQQRPWQGGVDGPVSWSGETFARLSTTGRRLDRPPARATAAALTWQFGAGGRTMWLDQDHLLAAQPAAGPLAAGRGLAVLTPRGVVRVDREDDLPRGLSRPLEAGEPGGFERLAWSVDDTRLLVWRGTQAWQVPARGSGLLAAPQEVIEREMAGELWSVGPLLARRGGPAESGGQPVVELRLRALNGEELTALDRKRRLRIDRLRKLRHLPEGRGDLYLDTAAGLVRHPAGLAALEQVELVGGSSERGRHFLVLRDGDLFGLEYRPGQDTTCFKLRPDGRAACTGAGLPEGRVATSTRRDGRPALVAEDISGGWRFSLRSAASAPLDPVSLRDGRFSHDRITVMTWCEGRFHFLDADGRHGIASRAEDWAEAVQRPVHLPDGMPALTASGAGAAQLLCPGEDARLGAQARDLPPLLVTQQAKVLALQAGDDATRAAPLPAAQADALRAWAVASNRQVGMAPEIAPEAPLFLFRKSPGAGLHLSAEIRLEETLLFAGEGAGSVQVLARDRKGRGVPLVDQPELFLVLGRQVWAVTPGGLAPYGAVDAGKAMLTPENGAPVPLPEGCKVVGARQISLVKSDLLCASGEVVPVTLANTEGRNGGAAVPIVGKRAPAPAVSPVTLGALQVTATPETGLVALRLGGEDLDLDRLTRGFSFDHLRDLHVDGAGGLHVVSAMGWHGFDGGNLSLVAPGDEGAAPATRSLRRDHGFLQRIVAIHATDRDNLVCLQIAEGEAAIAELTRPGLRIDRTLRRDCVPFLGRDRLRSHWRSVTGLYHPVLILPDQSRIPDRFLAGGFGSDKAADHPTMAAAAPRPDAAGLSYCAASELPGVVILGGVDGAPERARAAACTPRWDRARPVADGRRFLIAGGRLLKAPLR